MSSEALNLVLENEKDTPKLQPGDVYSSCKKWAKHACSTAGKEETGEALRQQLGDLILLVDFKSMTLESFLDEVIQDNILADREKVQFLKDIRYRQKKEQNTFFVESSSEVQQQLNHSGLLHGISFKTSKDAVLRSAALYLPFEPGSLSGQLEIMEEQTVIYTQNVALSYEENEKNKHIPLINEINIQSGVIYSVRHMLKGVGMYSGLNYKGKQVVNGVEFEFMELHAGESSANSGQIHGLTFYTI